MTEEAPQPSPWSRFLALAFSYYRGPTALVAWGVTLGLMVLTVAQVFVTLEINRFMRMLFDAFEAKALEQLPALTLRFAVILLATLTVTALHLTVKRAWQLSWRRFLTDTFLNHWLERGHYHRLRHLPDAADNPDARIAEDARIATEVTVTLFHSLLYSLLSLALFADVLWKITAELDYGPPGLMILLAFLYAGVGSLIGWLLGWPLTRATHQLQSKEADFRYALARVREKSEAIAIAHGDDREKGVTQQLFAELARAWHRQTRGYLGIVTFSTAYGTLLPVFPLLVLAAPYITGAITLGLLIQAAQAFERLTSALSWPVDNQGEIARCRASLERLAHLWVNLEALDARDAVCPLDAPCVTANGTTALKIDRLTLATPNGQTLLADFSAECARGSITLWEVSEEAKVPLLKAIAGLWSWGSGLITIPEGEQVAILPLRPYLPEGTLLAALTYPEPPTSERRAAVEEMLRPMGLDSFVARLDEHQDWNRTLPPSRQRQLALVRLLLGHSAWWVIECDHWPDPIVSRAVALARSAGAPPPGVAIVTSHTVPPSAPHEPPLRPALPVPAEGRAARQSSDG